MSPPGLDYDYIVIGSGFGGSVSALRLAQKGYRVAVIERGRRYRPQDFPRRNWNLRRFLWLPQLGLYGLWELTWFRHAFVLSGCGVGGGSLLYANTLLRPKDEVFADPAWARLEDWPRALAPHYQTARQMLGATPCPRLFKGDHILSAAVKELRPQAHMEPVDVGIYFGEPDQQAPDPYFAGQGPPRVGCNFCGGCMTGCRPGAKNTLDKNYLHLAEGLGVKVIPEQEVTLLAPLDGEDGASGYRLQTRRSTGLLRTKRDYTSRGVVLAAGSMGTCRLLLRMRSKGLLPRLSARLGSRTRTNSEALVGGVFSRLPEKGFSEGIAISGVVSLDEHTQVEVVRFGKGHDAMALFCTELTGLGPLFPRWLRWLGNLVRHPLRLLRRQVPLGWADSGIILLYMQSVDNSLRFVLRRGRLATEPEEGRTAPTYFPDAHHLARSVAAKIRGVPQSSIPEALLNLSTTAHILGGCPMGEGPEQGVVDRAGNVFGYQNLKVIDGSLVTVNLGVNPSLTITALAEYALAATPPREQTWPAGQE